MLSFKHYWVGLHCLPTLWQCFVLSAKGRLIYWETNDQKAHITLKSQGSGERSRHNGPLVQKMIYIELQDFKIPGMLSADSVGYFWSYVKLILVHKIVHTKIRYFNDAKVQLIILLYNCFTVHACR